jgi:hypothetical protein
MRTLWLVGLAVLVSLGGAQTRTQRGATQQDDGRIPIAQAAQELAQKFKAQMWWTLRLPCAWRRRSGYAGARP